MTKLQDGESAEVYQFMCIEPKVIELPLDPTGKFSPTGKPTKIDKFSIGALSGFEMALDDMRAQGFDHFRSGEYVSVECAGLQPSGKGSDMVKFSVMVGDSAAAVSGK